MGYKLSIIIPIYNVEKYIADCLHSIFDQNAEGNYEVILVNDGTKDCSMEIAREICSGKPNVTVAQQENQGLSAARMRGLAEAKGEYVWFVDSDDWLVDNALETVFTYIEDSSYDVIVTPISKYREETPSIQNQDIRISKTEIMSGREYLKKGFPAVNAVRCIVRRDLFANTRLYFPIGLLHEDAYFGRVLFYESKKVVVLDTALYKYRTRRDSIMTSHSIRSSYDLVLIYKLLIDYMQKTVEKEDLLWFRRNVFIGTLGESYNLCQSLFGSHEFRVFLFKNRRMICNAYNACKPTTTLPKQIIDHIYIAFPHWFYRWKKDVRFICFN